MNLIFTCISYSQMSLHVLFQEEVASTMNEFSDLVRV